MRPLFTIHGGEYLVGSYIERKFKRVNVWVPSRDSGVDLLVSDSGRRRTTSLQVKFSKDYLVTNKWRQFREMFRAYGFWSINSEKLRRSPADFWVLVLYGFAGRSLDYIVVPKERLLRRLQTIHGKQKTIRTYLCVTRRGDCWETRGLREKDELRIAHGTFNDGARNFKKWLNNWKPIARLNA